MKTKIIKLVEDNLGGHPFYFELDKVFLGETKRHEPSKKEKW